MTHSPYFENIGIASYKIGVALFSSKALQQNQINVKTSYLSKKGFVVYIDITLFIFARGKFKIKLFLNGLWYEPETLRLLLNFTRDYFPGKKNSKKY